MLLALLNVCSKEELEETDEDLAVPATPVEESAERRRVIKNKILAVGRMSRVFALLRYVRSTISFLFLTFSEERNPNVYQSSRVSLVRGRCLMVRWPLELKASRRLSPISTMRTLIPPRYPRALLTPSRRKSDIENERLPPDLYDADSEEGRAMMTNPPSPSEDSSAPIPANGVSAALEEVISNGSLPPTPGSASSAGSMAAPSPFRRGHGRQASLGTTMTSPSTRRRSIESTISLIREAVDGKEEVETPTNAAAVPAKVADDAPR